LLQLIRGFGFVEPNLDFRQEAYHLPYCLVRTGIGGVVAPSPRCERAASHI